MLPASLKLNLKGVRIILRMNFILGIAEHDIEAQLRCDALEKSQV